MPVEIKISHVKFPARAAFDFAADISRRAVACKRWKWIGGMPWEAMPIECPKCFGHGCFDYLPEDHANVPCMGVYDGYTKDMKGALPDLILTEDVDRLEQIVMEAWRWPNYSFREEGEFTIIKIDQSLKYSYVDMSRSKADRAALLVAMLEAAP